MSQHPGRPLRVVFVDHSGSLGGGQLGLARYLEHPSEFDRALVLLEPGPLAERARQAGIPTTVLSGRGGKRGALAKAGALRRQLRRLRPDVVVANSLRCTYLLGLAKFHGPAWVTYVREDVSRRSLSRFKRAALHVALPRFDGLIANSRSTLRGVPARRLRHTPHAVAYPVSGIDNGTCAQTHADRLPSRKLRVLSLSRLYEWKGVHILIQAAAELARSGHSADFVFTVAGGSVFGGDGYVERLQTMAAESGADIRFVGHVDDVDELLAAHDVLALCSLTPEAFGQVVPQSMAHGLVVVATDQGGPAEIIEHGSTGMLLPPDDPDRLASALLRLHDDSPGRRTIGAQAIERSREFIDARTIPAFEDAIVSVSRARQEDGEGGRAS